MPLDHYDVAIIRYLGVKEQANTNQISSGTGISWGATEAHLNKLRAEGYVLGKQTAKSIIWSLIN